MGGSIPEDYTPVLKGDTDPDGLLRTTTAVIPSSMDEISGAAYGNRYWLAMGSYIYVCDLEKRTKNGQPPWTRYDGHDVNCFCVTRADEYGLFAGSRGDGTIYQLATGADDNGVPIPMRYRTPPLAAKGFTSVKHIKHTHIAAEAPVSQALMVTVTADDVSPPPQVFTVDSSTDMTPVRLLTPARGRYAQVEIASDGANQDLTISEITMTYNPKPRVR